MRIYVLLIVLLTVGCSAPRSGKTDYTMNKSRSKSQPSQRKTYTSTARIGSTPSTISSNKGTSLPNEVLPAAAASSEDDMIVGLLGTAESLIGTSYRYGGTSPERGFDCSGFTSYVFGSQAISLPRTSTDQSKFGRRKDFRDAEVGDLVFFGTGSRVNHVGIVVEKSRGELVVIHSTSSSGVRKDEINSSPYWRSRKLWAVAVDRN